MTGRHEYDEEFYSPDIEPRRKKSLRDHRAAAVLPAKKPKRRGVMRTDPTKCHYCKNHFETYELTRDHIVPKSKGGLNRVWNIVPACLKCNQEKGQQWPTCNCDFCRESVRKHADVGITFFDTLPRHAANSG